MARPSVPDPLSGRDAMLGEAWHGLDTDVVDEEQLQDLLQLVAEGARRGVPPADAAGITVRTSRRPLTAAYTSAWTLAIDRGQYERGEGPCLTAAQEDRVVVVDVAQAVVRWPAFSAAAAARGVRSVLAAPLSAAGGAVGALNLYARGAGGFDDADREVATLLAARAGRALAGYLRYRDAVVLAEQLEEAMASRAVIEQAKGALMVLRGVDEEGAFALLREDSQRLNRKLRTVARELVDGLAAGAETAPGAG